MNEYDLTYVHKYKYNYIYKYPTRCNNAQYIFFISLQIYSFTLNVSGAIYTHHQEYRKL
jgi:hypothetical protein